MTLSIESQVCPCNTGVSIVIVTHNSWPEVDRCLESVFANAPEMPFEVILLDNASTDDTVESVRGRWPAVQLITSETNHGYGRAVNLAVAKSVGKTLVLLNPDTVIYDVGFFARLIEAAERPGVGVVGPRLVNDDGMPLPSARRFPDPFRLIGEALRLHKLLPSRVRAQLLLGTYWDQAESRDVDWICGACHVLRREVWDEVGPLTEATFCGFDDFDYCLRARRAGLRTWIVGDVELQHSVSTSVNRRWSPAEVEALATNNMFVLLHEHWPRWRYTLYGLAEAFACATEVVHLAVSRRAARQDETLRLAAARSRRALSFAVGWQVPATRCDP